MTSRILQLALVLLLSSSGAAAQTLETTTQNADVAPPRNWTELGPITFGGLLQGWYSSGNSGFDDTFRIRRTELKFTGHTPARVNWTVMIDPAKVLPPNAHPHKAGIMLQDAFVTFNLHERVNVNVGRFKIPLSLEGLQSSAELDTERAMFMVDRARGGAYGDIRDIGVMAYGPLTKSLDYQVGFFDGAGSTLIPADRHDPKAIAGRLVYRPGFLPGLQVGASGVRENAVPAAHGRRTRLGTELLYVKGLVTLQGEYMTGTDLSLAREGYYAHFAYRLAPRWEAIVRYDAWDPDTHQELTPASVTERDYIAGVSYFIAGNHAKLQFNYVHKTFTDNIVGSVDLAQLRLQTSW
ncbi:MAG TPA: porin [Vicinamibacterales bacterium]